MRFMDFPWRSPFRESGAANGGWTELPTDYTLFRPRAQGAADAHETGRIRLPSPEVSRIIRAMQPIPPPGPPGSARSAR